MKLSIVVLTTSPTHWMEKDFVYIKRIIQTAPGVIVEEFNIKPIVIKEIPLQTDKDGDKKPNWNWFTENVTKKVSGYNVVCLHLSRDFCRKSGITVNGTYKRDTDSIFEFWISANKSQRAKKYSMSEFSRVFLHELGHGFERYLFGNDIEMVHDYDYNHSKLIDLFPLFDFAKYESLLAKKNMLEKLIESLKQQKPQFILPIQFATQISNPFAQRGDYASGVHPGIDYRCPIGTPVYAPTDGTIINAIAGNPSMGNAVYFHCIIGGKKYWMRFLHLHTAAPIGSYKKGDLIGLTGNTGKSTGPHLHHDIWNVPVDSRLIQTKEGVLLYMVDPQTFWKQYINI